MKIALIDPSLFTWPYDVHLAKGLADNGHEVVVFGRNPGRALPPSEAPFLRQHFYPGFESRLIKKLPKGLFLALKGLSHIESMLRLVGALRVWKPDVIHFQWTPLAVIDKRFIATLRSLAPVVLTVHDSAPFNNNPSAALQRLGAIDIMNRFDQLIVHTETARKRLQSYGIPPAKINIIPHGLLFDPTASMASVAYTPAADGHVNMLLFGQIKPYKGVDVILRAIAKLPEAVRQKCTLRVVGRPHMPMEPIMALVDELGVKKQVEFDLRFVPDEDVANIMTSADIQLFPYREIDASGVLLLGLVAGRAIVASDIGIFSELLQNGVHGALVKPNDPDALALALAPLIEDTGKRVAAAKAVKALADSIPDWKEIGRRTEAVYRKG